MTKEMAQEFNFDCDTARTLEKQYMRAQLANARTPSPKAIGIDEISIRNGHTYRIVASALGSCGDWRAKSLQKGSTVNSAATLAIED